MNLVEFNRRFPNEQSCRQHLKEQRERAGITCVNCAGTKHYWIQSIEKWRCANCKTCINLRAGTIMEKSKLSFTQWFLAIHLMTSTKKSFSALEMQRQLGMKRYYPVWYMMTKIRAAMGKRDDRYKLKGTIEVDDAFFEIVDTPELDELGNKVEKDTKLKRGRGSQRQMAVLVMVESEPNPAQTNKNKKNRKMGYVKMKVMDDLNGVGINYEIRNAVDPCATILTDGYKSYNNLADVVEKHVQMVVPAKEAHKKLPWVHTVISNAKRLFLGTHHSINKDHLQTYLDEYCYKLNRRHLNGDLFDRMLLAGISA